MENEFQELTDLFKDCDFRTDEEYMYFLAKFASITMCPVCEKAMYACTVCPYCEEEKVI